VSRVAATILFAALTLVVCAGSPARAGEAWQGRAIHGCDVEEGYRPFTYYEQDRQPRGYDVDLMREAIEGTGLRLEVRFLPPKRCASAVDSGEMDLDMADPWSDALAEAWLVSHPIWHTTDALFYDRTRFPGGLTVAEIRAHPAAHPGCGIFGYPYEDFPKGEIDTSAYTYDTAFTRMLSGHCEFVVEALEFGLEYRYRGRRLLEDPRLAVVTLPLRPQPGAPQKVDPDGRFPYYIYLRRTFPDAPALLARIDATIALWQRTGKDREVMARYLDLARLEAAR